MVVVAQLVRASDCGSESRRFESGLPPHLTKSLRGNYLKKIVAPYFLSEHNLFHKFSGFFLNKRITAEKILMYISPVKNKKSKFRQ